MHELLAIVKDLGYSWRQVVVDGLSDCGNYVKESVPWNLTKTAHTTPVLPGFHNASVV